jgi:hypothetical protein
MRRTRERRATPHLRARCSIALHSAGMLAAALSCTTRLDPSFVAASQDDAGTAPLPTCSSFTQAARTYVVCSKPLDFEAATFDCMLRGATLAAVGTTQENDFVATNAGSVVNDDLWLGGTRDDSYVWRWPDGTIFWRGGPDGAAEGNSFVSWFPGEPNDSSTVTTDPERCLALRINRTDWNDRACTLELPYVCEQASAAP